MYFTLGDLVTDIVQNAAESGAALVELDIRETGEEFRFTVRDNGRGMDKDGLKRAADPFAGGGGKHPRRKVGLGIPFLVQTVEQSGGGWDIQSEKGEGTTVSAWFDPRNPDTPPAGDIGGVFRTALMFPGPEELFIRRIRDGEGRSYEIRRSELAEALGGLENAGSLVLLDRYLKSMEEDDEETRREKT